jgi:hypothetical protein
MNIQLYNLIRTSLKKVLESSFACNTNDNLGNTIIYKDGSLCHILSHMKVNKINHLNIFNCERDHNLL